MSPNPERNVGREIADQLVDKFGFEAAEGRPGRFHKLADSQHAVVVTDGRWHVGPNGGDSVASLSFGLARRDVNDLRRDLLHHGSGPWAPEIMGSWSPTVRVTHRFSPETTRLWYLKHTAEDVAAWLDEWIPRLVEEAPSYQFLTETIELMGAHENMRQETVVPRMMQALLDGWTEADEVEFIGPWLDIIDRFPADDERVVIRQAQLKRVRAWLVEHPKGVERELVG